MMKNAQSFTCSTSGMTMHRRLPTRYHAHYERTIEHGKKRWIILMKRWHKRHNHLMHNGMVGWRGRIKLFTPAGRLTGRPILQKIEPFFLLYPRLSAFADGLFVMAIHRRCAPSCYGVILLRFRCFMLFYLTLFTSLIYCVPCGCGNRQCAALAAACTRLILSGGRNDE